MTSIEAPIVIMEMLIVRTCLKGYMYKVLVVTDATVSRSRYKLKKMSFIKQSLRPSYCP